MFKTALSSLSSTLLKTARSTIEEYNPTPDNIIHGVFDRLAQQGIANLSYRSPILSSLAQVAMDNFQKEIKKKKYVSDYVNSKQSDWLRESVKGKAEPDAKESDITDQMKVIITKITDAIDAEGVENVKKAGIFKEYEKIFDQYKQETSKPAEQSQASSNKDTTQAVLDDIEANTKDTVEALTGLDLDPYDSRDGTVPKGQLNPNKFIDPLTGMPSITAAVGAIGGNFLAKVFDEETLTKFSKKAKEFLHPELRTTVPEPVTKTAESVAKETRTTVPEPVTKTAESVAKETRTTVPRPKPIPQKTLDDILGDISLDLNAPATTEDKKELYNKQSEDRNKLQNVSEQIRDELKDINSKVDKLSPGATSTRVQAEPSKVLETLKDKLGGAISSRVPSTLKGSIGKILDIGKKAAGYVSGSKLGNVLSTVASNTSSILSDIPTPSPKNILSGARTVASGATSLISRAASLINPVTKVAAAGAAGYAAGKLISGGIDSGLSAMTGKDTTLGGWIYDKTHPTTPENVTPAKKNQAAVIQQVTAAKVAAETKQAAQPPIVLNTNNVQQSSGASSISVKATIRNTETSFERVQMQDFWSRTQ